MAMDSSEFLKNFRKMKESARMKAAEDFLNQFQGANLSAEELLEQLYGDPRQRAANDQQASNRTKQNQNWFNPFESVFGQYQYTFSGGAAQTRRPAQPIVNPDVRRREIEHELEIIKGIIPTPKGYTITTSKAKALVVELRELNKTKQT